MPDVATKHFSGLVPFNPILSEDIVAEQLDYEKTMKREEEVSNSGKIRQTDEEFLSEKTHCTFYTKATSAIFNIFKKANPRLKNIYMTLPIRAETHFISFSL